VAQKKSSMRSVSPSSRLLCSLSSSSSSRKLNVSSSAIPSSKLTWQLGSEAFVKDFRSCVSWLSR